MRSGSQRGFSRAKISDVSSYPSIPDNLFLISLSEGMSRHLAVEWGPDGIRVNCVAPGAVKDTEGFRRLGKELQGSRICSFYLHLMQFSYHTILVSLEQKRALGCNCVDCYGDQKQFWHPKFQQKHPVFGKHVESF